MKKFLIVAILLIVSFGTYTEARVQYDETGRTIVKDDTIRGRKRAAEAQRIKEERTRAALAAKLDYEDAIRYIENKPKTNFYQSRIKEIKIDD